MASRPACPFCGASVSAEARYCDHCGTPLAQSPTPSRRQAAMSTLRVSAWVAVGVLFALFAVGVLGGFRYQAERWPWNPALTAAAPEPSGDGTPPPAQKRPDNQAVAGYLRSVVSVNVRGSEGNKSGSGFILPSRRHVVTVAHVLDGLSPGGCATVIDDDGKPHFSKVVGRDNNLDIAVLEVPTLSSWPTGMSLGSSASLSPGDQLYVMGTPKGSAQSALLPGTFNRVNKDLYIEQRFFAELLQVTGAVVLDGSSGGPLVEQKSGKVVGVVNAGTKDAPVSYAVPIDKVAPLLERWTTGPSVGACAMEPSQQSVPVTLATIMPLSGPFGVFGADLALGAELALRDMEADLRRVGYEVELRKYDDRGSVTTAAETARSVGWDPKVIGVVGSLDNQVTRALSGALAEAGVPVVAPMAGSEELTAARWSHFNRLVANARRQEQALARFAHSRLKAKGLVILEDGSPEAATQLRGFETAAEVISLPVLERILFTPDPPPLDLKARLGELKADSILVAGKGENTVKAIAALRLEGVNLPILGTEALYDRLPSLPVTTAKSIYFTHLTVQASEPFQKHFETTLGKPTRGYAAYGYDAARVILEALVRHGEVHPAKVPTRSELAERVRQTVGYPGRAVAVTFDESGENRTAWIYLFEWTGGKAELREQFR